MNRREFIKIGGLGALTLFLGGCGATALTEEKNALVAGNISGGANMKIVVINSSPHSESQSTSRFLAQKFSEGARSAGHEIFTFDAANEETHPCRGCDHCGMDGPCVYNDAISTKLMPAMLEADLLVLVTPLYYYGMSAQLKIIVDRFYARTGRLHRKKSLLLATAWNTADWTMTALETHYNTLVRYMEWENIGAVLATGCGYRSAVENSEFGDAAFRIGANLWIRTFENIGAVLATGCGYRSAVENSEFGDAAFRIGANLWIRIIENIGAILATGCGYRSAVENSEFGDAAFRIGANLWIRIIEKISAILATGCGYRSAVENSEFGDAAFKIGANL